MITTSLKALLSPQCRRRDHTAQMISCLTKEQGAEDAVNRSLRAPDCGFPFLHFGQIAAGECFSSAGQTLPDDLFTDFNITLQPTCIL
jgi:hypothetical protein